MPEKKGPTFGNGKLDAIQVVGPMTLADTAMPTLALQHSDQPVRGEKQTVQRHNATVTIAPTGGTGSKLLITLTVERRDFTGADIADLTHTITGAAAKVPWSSTDFTASTTASAATLKDVMDLINELPGFKAWVLHAPHSQSVDSDDFIALAATGIKSNVGVDGRSEVLYRDVSEDVNAYLRIGLPEERDRDAIELHEIVATATGVTNGTLKVTRDDYDDFGDTQEEYESEILLAARTSYLGYTKLTAPVIRGPILIHATSDDLTAIELRARIKQAQIGM